MAICKFWSQGNCRFGDRCKFEHPDDRNSPSNNRYAPPNNSSSSRNVDTYRPSYNDNRNTRDTNDGRQPGWPSIRPPATLPFQLDKAVIITDLTTERPQWILSAYGPGRGAPAQLFGGPGRELSFEELRVAHYIALASGNPQQAVQEAEQLAAAADQQIQQAVNKIDDAIEYIIRAENDHPNRVDIVIQSQAATGGPGMQPNPFQKSDTFVATPAAKQFGSASQSAANAFAAPSGSGVFGQPSALGQKPDPFGAPSAPTTGAFGQPSALGQKPNPFAAVSQPTTSAFGAPSVLGQKSNPFGASSATSGVFGAPSAMGQKPTPFGAPSSSSTNQGATGFSAFANKPNPFAQKPTTSNAFGQPSQPNQPNPFGQTPAPTQDLSRGQNPLSLPASSQTTPFGAPSPVGANPFAQAPRTAQSSGLNPFSAKTQPTTQPSGPNPNTFNATPGTLQQNPFAAAQKNGVSNGLGPPNPNGYPKAPNAPSSSPQTGELPDISKLSIHPPLESYSSKDANGRLTMFKGKQVIHDKDNKPTTKDADGFMRPIRFPNGPPDPVQGVAKPIEEYDDDTKDAYAYFKKYGQFKDGIMPLMPPRSEWCQWDF